MKKTLAIFPMSFVLICFFLLSFSACEPINQYKDKALSLIGWDSSQKEKETKKIAPTDKDQKDTPAQKPKTDDNNDIIVTRVKANTQAIKKTDLKAAIAPPFTVEAPVDVKKRVGGTARFITADEKFTYLDFPQHFAVYDANLSLVARHAISYPLLKIKRHDIGDKTYFYLTEEKNVLEIYELQTVTEQGSPYYVLNEVASYDAGAPFTWVNAQLLVILYKDKIQFNDFSNFDEPKVVAEMPIGNVTATFPIGKYLFLSRQDFLDIVDTESYTLVSTVRVGSSYGFLGETKCKNLSCLVLSQLTPEGHLKGLQYLQITEDGSAVIDLGDSILLGQNLSAYTFDLNRGFVIGKEVSESGETPVHLFSVNERRFLRGPLSQEPHLLTWSLTQDQLYLVTHLDITINHITLNNDVISQSRSLKTPHTSLVTPLAQIGATKLIKDEYTLTHQIRVEFMADAKKVFLLDRDHFVIFESTQDQKHHRIYASRNFSQDDFTLVEPVVDGAAPASGMVNHYAQVLPSSLGLFLYSDDAKKLSLLDPHFESIKTLPVKMSGLSSLAHFSTDDQEILALTTIPDFNLDFYTLKSPQDVALQYRATFEESPHLVFIPSDQIVAIIKNKMFLYSWQGILHPESETLTETDPMTIKPIAQKTKKPPPNQIPVPPIQETIHYDLGGLDYALVSAKIAPSYDTIYLLIETKKRLKIAVVDLFDVTQFAILEDFDITPEQFKGSSFAKDGRLFILPSSEGTLFYDMTHLDNIKEVAHWSLASEHVDVVDNGRFICVALEHLGVYCGDLLF